MSNQDVIFSKISIIKNCMMAIEKVKKQESDPDFKQGLYELNLQRAIQACIDMAHVVIAQEGLSLPNNYRQAFEILSRFGVITESTSHELIKMVGFRNISVHDYQVIDPAIVENIVEKHLDTFERFYEVVYKRAQAWAE